MYVESIIHDFLDISGNELMFKYRALQGDPDYAPYWDRAEAIPEEYKYPTMAQGIDTILKEFILNQSWQRCSHSEHVTVKTRSSSCR